MEFLRWVRNQWDRSAAAVAALAGFVTVVAGWFGASASSKAGEQIPYVISGGLMGLFLLGVAATLWLSADLRDEWRKVNECYETLRRSQS